MVLRLNEIHYHGLQIYLFYFIERQWSTVVGSTTFKSLMNILIFKMQHCADFTGMLAIDLLHVLASAINEPNVSNWSIQTLRRCTYITCNSVPTTGE